ncbi:MAG: glycosyltransferase, partial [Roseiflexaceae bacterium]
EADFDRLHARGINTIRVFLNYYVFGGAIPIFNGTQKGIALQHFETLLNAANARGIYVMPVLYAKYPQTNFASPHYATALDVHARPLVRYFAGHPGIIAWDIFNEPDIGSPIDLRCWDWDNADYAGCYPLAQERLYFLSTVAQDIKQLDPTHLRTIGMAFAKSHAEPREAPLRIADMVDFYTFHYYDDSPYDSGRYKLHWYYGRGFPHDLRRSIQELHDLGLGKPIVVTELGFPTDPADGTRNAAELARDLAVARDVLRDMGTSGMVIWMQWLAGHFACPVLLYNTDDPTGSRDTSRFTNLISSLAYYSLCVFVRQETALEALALGAKRVIVVNRSYDEISHHLDLTKLQQSPQPIVSFVGTLIPGESRDRFLAALVQAGLPLRVIGGRWQRSSRWRDLKSIYQGPGRFGKAYSHALGDSAVSLGFLSHQNRDLVTRRSFETPACGGLLCAERTSEHQLLYEDGREAVFWDSLHECILQCTRLLANPALRYRICVNGMEHVRMTGMGNEDICRQILFSL